MAITRRWSLAALALVAAVGLAHPARGGGVFVSGEVPDWDQPYRYVGSPYGPGPNPTNPPAVDPFDAWCGPVSGANLLGHWEDVRGVAVADAVPFNLSSPSPPNAPIPWPGPPIWHDYSLEDPATRPVPAATPAVADLGWYMDTGHIGTVARGNVGGHVGTLAKDVHAGLQDLLDAISHGWITGTRGTTYGLGTDADGLPATPHPDELSAFAQIVREIDANRTLIVNWRHWTLTAALGPLPALPGASDESQFGGTYYAFATQAPDGSGNDEQWETDPNPQLNLGHITTAVGYIPAGDPDDINAPGNPTNWVIVHDNDPSTPRNVIVPLGPLQYANDWNANTTANLVLPVAIPLSPNDTYLRTNLDTAGDSVAIHLPALGIRPGDRIRIRRLGDWRGTSGGPDTETAMVAVFSSSDVLLAQDLQQRVPGAVDWRPDHVTLPTFNGNLPTDIAEDFFVDDVTTQVPPQGFYLFVAAPDNLYSDNGDPDGDFAVEISSPAIPVPSLSPAALALLVAVLAGAALAAPLVRRRRSD